jgi:uncharacterized membrane protein
VYYSEAEIRELNNEEPQDPEITNDDKLWAALAYLFPVIAPILIYLMEEKRDRPFIHAHTAQALVSGVILVIISPILIIATLGIGFLAYLIMAYWAFQAYHGRIVEIPFVTQWVKEKGWA